MEVCIMHEKRRVSVKIVSKRYANDIEPDINQALSEIYENANDPKIIDIKQIIDTKVDDLAVMIIYEWSEDPMSNTERLPEQIG